MKNLVSIFLVITILACTINVPVRAAQKITGQTVEISTRNYSRSYSTFNTKTESNTNPITFYVNNSEFPVKVTISSDDKSSSKYTFDSYGVKYVHDHCIYFPGSAYQAYATINIEPHPSTNATAVKKELSQDLVIDTKLDRLLKELDFGFYDDKTTPYGKELRAFLTEEWDGSWIPADIEDDYAGYIADREVSLRTYRWSSTNLYTGETYTKEVNVDYVGSLEIVPNTSANQDYSLVVDRNRKIVDQWSLLDKIYEWSLSNCAGAIDKIYIVGKDNDDSNECQAIVYINDTDKKARVYTLYPGGIVEN